MAYKTYQLNRNASRSTMRVFMPDGTSEFVTFVSIGYGTNYATGFPRFSTAKKNIQEGIEASEMFENDEITLLRTDDVPEDVKPAIKAAKSPKGNDDEPDADAPTEKAVFADVTTFRAAKEVLTGEPYNVEKTSPEIRSKEAIFKKADELGVSFPNLK